MTTPANAKPIITPVPGSVDPEAAAAAAAAGPGSPEQKAIDDAAAAAAAAAAGDPKETDADAGKPSETPPEDTDDPSDLTLTPEPDSDDTDDDTGDPVSVTETGYDEFDAISKLMVEKGMKNASEIMEAFLDTGEISLEHKAAMIESLGEGVASMAFKQLEDTATALINEVRADTKKTLDYANEKFNGTDAKTTWAQIQAYVKSPESGFSESDLVAMNAMLEAGGLQAQLVIDKVYSVYTADKTVSQPGTLLEGDAGSSGVTFQPISRLEYTEAMNKAVRDFGEDSFQVKELNRRRTLTMRGGR